MSKEKKGKNTEKKLTTENVLNNDYYYSMNQAPRIGENTHWFQMIPIAFFASVIIIITRMASYERPMDQFFWSGSKTQLSDFFSYYKMTAIIICAVFVIVLLLYRLFIQSFAIRKTFAYLPMLVYTVFVLISYAKSDYKLFALWGWNDRFEGTLAIIGYMIMLYYIINTIRSERDIKWVIYSLATGSALLGFLGLSQALDHDFLQTTIGKKLITPSWFWDQLANLQFTFQDRQIYQTVYNINYVSFYLTLLIPLFGMLFIKSILKGNAEPIWKKLIWGALFTLLIFNLIGSASSGGLFGMAVVVLMAIIVLNKKIIQWWKPIVILLILTVIVAGVSYNRWFPELSGAIEGVLGTSTSKQDNTLAEKESTNNANNGAATSDSAAGVTEIIRHKVDYMITSGDSIIVSFAGNEIAFKTYPDDPTALQITDADGKTLNIVPTNVNPIYRIDDPRFATVTIRPAQDDQSNYFLVIGTDGNEWPFMHTDKGPKYLTGLGKTVDLKKVAAVGWENNQSFGSGRGYIWSRSIPLIKDTLIIGHGADTFCIYFPHSDYVGKYNSGTFTPYKDIVVDKPHNMYLGITIGTGGISMLALLVLWGYYIIQSFIIYRKEAFTSFIEFTGAGIFLGISGFLISALVNDSSVSVMPMFYALLGTGIAINLMLMEKHTIRKIEK